MLTTTAIQSSTQLGRCALTGSPVNAVTFAAYEVDPTAETEPKLIRQMPLIQIPFRPQVCRHPAFQEIIEWLRLESDRVWNELREKIKAVRPTIMNALDSSTGTFRVCFEQFPGTGAEAKKASVCIEDVHDEGAAIFELNSVFTKLYPGLGFKILEVERLGDYPMPLPQEQA